MCYITLTWKKSRAKHSSLLDPFVSYKENRFLIFFPTKWKENGCNSATFDDREKNWHRF
jgi:hypothetical protein